VQEPELAPPPPHLRHVRQERRLHDHGERDQPGAEPAGPGRGHAGAGDDDAVVHPPRERGLDLRRFREPPREPGRHLLRLRPERGRGAAGVGPVGGLQGVRRERRRLHLRQGASGRPRKTRPGGRQHDRQCPPHDWVRRYQPRWPRRFLRVQGDDARHHSPHFLIFFCSF